MKVNAAATCFSTTVPLFHFWDLSSKRFHPALHHQFVRGDDQRSSGYSLPETTLNRRDSGQQDLKIVVQDLKNYLNYKFEDPESKYKKESEERFQQTEKVARKLLWSTHESSQSWSIEHATMSSCNYIPAIKFFFIREG